MRRIKTTSNNLTNMNQPTQNSGIVKHAKNTPKKQEQPIIIAVNLNTTYNILSQSKHPKMSWNNKDQGKIWNDITLSEQVKTSETNQKTTLNHQDDLKHPTSSSTTWTTKDILKNVANLTLSSATWNKLNNRDHLSNQKLSDTTETNSKQLETNGTTETTHNDLLSVATTYNNLKRSRPDQTTRSKHKQSQTTSRTQHNLKK